MGSTKSLDEFMDTVPESKPEVAEIDLAGYPGELPERMMFTYRHPSASQLFHAAKAGKKLSVQFNEMSDTLGVMCATMGLAHVSPAAERPSVLYAKMATKNSDLFLWLMRKFLDAYPDLEDLEAKVDEAKKLSSMGM